jgi:hypothetical protein
MTAAVFKKTEVGIKEFGSSIMVPDTPVAKLMYYLDCICTCVEADDDYSLRRLRNYKTNASGLSEEEKAKLLILCLALSPDKLIGTILFPNEDLDYDNDFFELNAVDTNLVVAESLVISGQRKRVRRIMMFKEEWMEHCYFNPLRSYESHQRAVRSPPVRAVEGLPVRGQRGNQSSDSGWCVIL